MRYARILLTGVLVALVVVPAAAQDDETGDEAPVKAEDAKVVAASVMPIVERLAGSDEDAEWQPLREGDTLGRTTVLRTGLGGQAVLQVADRGHITVESGTKVALDELVMAGEMLNVRMGLKYGTMDAQLPHAAGRSDMKVDTPVATLATRGCGMRVGFSGDLGLRFCANESTWDTRTNFGRMFLNAGECTDGALTPAIFITVAGRNTDAGDPHGGLTNLEQRNLLWHGGGRGIINFTGGRDEDTTLCSGSSRSGHSEENSRENGYETKP